MESQNSEPQAFKRYFAVLVLILIVLFVYVLHFYPSTPSEDKTSSRVFALKISVTYKNDGGKVWNLTDEDYTIGLLSNSTWQTVYLTNHSLPIESFKTDEDGNHIAVLNPPKTQLFPKTVWNYSVEYKIVTEPRLLPEIDERLSLNVTDVPEDLTGEFCKAEGPWQIDDPEIVELAWEIVGNETNVLKMIKKFVEWIKSNIRYETLDIPRYPNETLKRRAGDCDDQANLLIAFCRISGIPAHLQIGCIYMPNKINETSQSWGGHLVTVLSRIGWHGWAIVYVPPWGWLPVDLTYAPGISEDPLNAIKNSAVTLQETIHYMNITNTDYVNSSISSRNFLMNSEFYVTERDELIEQSTFRMFMGELPTKIFVVKPILLGHSSSYTTHSEKCETL